MVVIHNPRSFARIRTRSGLRFGQNAILSVGLQRIESPGETRVSDSEFERNLFELRREKLQAIEELGQQAYPNRFPASPDMVATTIPAVRAEWGETPAEV